MINTAEPQDGTNRLKELKQLKKLANFFLTYYLNQKKSKEKGWERGLSNRNIALLKATIIKLNKLLQQNMITEYLEATRPTQFISDAATEVEEKEAFQKILKNSSIVISQGNSYFLLLDIIRCSPRLSYINDLTWFKHGYLSEYIDYGLGKVDETIFEKYLPAQVNKIIETKKTFFSKEYYKDDLILLEAILKMIDEGHFIPSNILIITLIEGLVRKFALYVYKKQNPDIADNEADNFTYIGNSSFENLIKNTVWKKDISLTFAEFITEYTHTDSPIVTEYEERFRNHKIANKKIEKNISELIEKLSPIEDNHYTSREELCSMVLNHIDYLKNEANNLMKDEELTVWFGIDMYLDFLVKKFKEDRNNIIHGKYSFFKEKWKTLVYLTALQTLIEKILWHEKNIP